MTDRSVKPPPHFDDYLGEMMHWVDAQPDEATTVEAAGALIDMLQETSEKMARLRVAELRVLKGAGWSYSQLAEAFDLSRGRLEQMVSGRRKKR